MRRKCQQKVKYKIRSLVNHVVSRLARSMFAEALTRDDCVKLAAREVLARQRKLARLLGDLFKIGIFALRVKRGDVG